MSTLFEMALKLEEDPHAQDAAILTYRQVLQYEPDHTAAHINIGTLYYNSKRFEKAEQHYRLAIATDPKYALAYFNLGNVVDETGRIEEAVQVYRKALEIKPDYADCHYNLALAFEKLKQPAAALLHWRAYVRLDIHSPWSVHARNQIERILKTIIKLTVVSSNPNPTRTSDRAPLFLV